MWGILRPVLSVSVIVVTLASTGAHAEDLGKQMAGCAIIEGQLSRLQCFDDLARTSGLTPQVDVTPPSENTGKWHIVTDKNPIDDTTSVFLAVIADNVTGRFGQPIALSLRCRSGKTEAYIMWNDFLGGDSALVTTRIGEEKAVTARWGTSSDKQGAFFPGKSIDFIRKLSTVSSFVAQVTPYNESPKTAVFDVSGLSEAMKPLAETCKWNAAEPSPSKAEPVPSLPPTAAGTVRPPKSKVPPSKQQPNVAKGPQDDQAFDALLGNLSKRGAAGPQLSTSEIDLVRQQIEHCWNPSAAAKEAHDLIVDITAEVGSDGRVLTAQITSTARMGDPFYRAAAESALRAVLNPNCSPLKLPPDKYDQWKTLYLTLNPKDLL